MACSIFFSNALLVDWAGMLRRDDRPSYRGVRTMDVAYITALSALAGSVVGGLTAGLTTWLSHRAQVRASHRGHQVARRQDLFSNFIASAAKTFGSALVTNELQIVELVELHGRVSQMRVLCSPKIVACADALVHTIGKTYARPAFAARELLELAESRRSEMDVLRQFSEMARDELEELAAPLL